MFPLSRKKGNQIKVLVADDSAFMRKVISDLVNSQPDMRVVDVARDGIDALEKSRVHQPDVITLDVEMPRMDGLTALSRLMAEDPRPVVMLSSLTQVNARVTIEALARGAIDFVPKPSGTISLDLHKMKEDLWRKIRVASRVRVMASKESPPYIRGTEFSPGKPERGTDRPAQGPPDRVVVIGSSTGGPGALQQILPQLPEDFPAAVLVVQHMPRGFTSCLAERLDSTCRVRVREAGDGEALRAGQVLVAPGDYHLLVRDRGHVGLDRGEPVHGLRPAVDVTLRSAVRVYGARAVAVILTGMGSDGARGARELKSCGGRVIAQNKESCVVYGMPRAVVEMGLADQVLPLRLIPEKLGQLLNATPAPGASDPGRLVRG